MQFIKDAVGLAVVFGPALLLWMIVIYIETAVRHIEYRGEWLIKCWTAWAGFALLFKFEGELRGLARGVAAWL